MNAQFAVLIIVFIFLQGMTLILLMIATMPQKKPKTLLEETFEEFILQELHKQIK